MSGERAKVLTLVFTDLADSTALKSVKGDEAVDALLARHRSHVARLAEECAGRIVDWAGDGCFLTFETSSAGVLFALRLQHVHAEEQDLPGVRIGIHLGEVSEGETPEGAPQVKGLAVDVAARIQGLAKPGQVLMSSAVYNSAKQRMGVEAMGMPLLWQLHGTYALKGFDTPLDIGEAGIQGVAPLEAPKAGDKAQLIRKARKQPEQYKESARRGVPVWVFVATVIVLFAANGYFALRPNGTPRGDETAGLLADRHGPIRRFSINVDPLYPLYVLAGRSIVLSPDEDVLVYVAGTSSETDLVIREMDSGTSSVLPGTRGARSPFFSPSGDWIAFYDRTDGTLKKIPSRGGTAIPLADASWWGGVWGEDGHVYYATDSGIFRVREDGGDPERLTTFTDEEILHVPNDLLQSSRTLLYTAVRSPAIEDTSTVAYSLDAGRSHTILESAALPRYAATGHLVYVASEGLMAVPFDAQTLELRGVSIPVSPSRMLKDPVGGIPTQFEISAGGTLIYGVEPMSDPYSSIVPLSSLVWVDRMGKESPLDFNAEVFVDPRLSPDGRQLATVIAKNVIEMEVWIYDLVRETRLRLTFSPLADRHPTWSPDGSRIVFISARRRVSGLYRRRADGTGEAEPIMSSGLDMFPLDWVSSLSRILVARRTSNDPVTYAFSLVSPDTDDPPQTILDTPFRNRAARISPDGGWIAYQSNPSGQFEVYVQKFPEMKGRWQISTDGGENPLWSQDSSEIYYRDGESVVAVPVELGPEVRVGQPEKLFDDPYAGHADMGSTIYDIAPDGRFLMLKPVEGNEENEPMVQGTTELGIVLNWTEELKRVAPPPESN